MVRVAPDQVARYQRDHPEFFPEGYVVPGASAAAAGETAVTAAKARSKTKAPKKGAAAVDEAKARAKGEPAGADPLAGLRARAAAVEAAAKGPSARIKPGEAPVGEGETGGEPRMPQFTKANVDRGIETRVAQRKDGTWEAHLVVDTPGSGRKLVDAGRHATEGEAYAAADARAEAERTKLRVEEEKRNQPAAAEPDEAKLDAAAAKKKIAIYKAKATHWRKQIAGLDTALPNYAETRKSMSNELAGLEKVIARLTAEAPKPGAAGEAVVAQAKAATPPAGPEPTGARAVEAAKGPRPFGNGKRRT